MYEKKKLFDNEDSTLLENMRVADGEDEYDSEKERLEVF